MSAAAWRERFLNLTSLGVLLGVWVAMSYVAGTATLPLPSEVWSEFVPLVTEGRFIEPLLGSLTRTGLSFLAAMFLGISYGVAAARSERFAQVTTGIFNIALFAPTLIMVFIGLLILGVDDSSSVIIIVALATFPSVAVYMRDVLRGMDDELLTMAHSFRFRPWRRFVDLYLPYLAPALLSTSRLAFNTAWKVVVLAEVFGFPSGLGFQIRSNYSGFNIPRLIAWLGIFVVTLLFIEQIIRAIERGVVRWR